MMNYSGSVSSQLCHCLLGLELNKILDSFRSGRESHFVGTMVTLGHGAAVCKNGQLLSMALLES